MGDTEYTRIKSRLLRLRKLFEDPDFPATGRSIRKDGSSSPYIRWLRPGEILESIRRKPQFIVGGVTRHDIYQGELGDCWFIAAASCLALTSHKLFERVVPLDQSFDKDYAGIFRFWFWQFDTWVEVVVDDRLPTKNGEPMFAHNKSWSQYHEFWPALLEKAYAKLYGGYENIHGGHINDALVDFTGGISERISLSDKSSIPDSLFSLLQRTLSMNSMMGSSILKKSNVTGEEDRGNGLYAGHAYSITKATEVVRGGKTEKLLRLRNPWGRTEWNGRWGDKSREWHSVSEADKTRLGLIPKNDGEFWMEYDDWLDLFDKFNICHLYPDALTKEVAKDTEKRNWEVATFHGNWIRGLSAGGSGNSPYQDLFWTNPQFAVTLKSTDDEDRDGRCTIITSLMQKSDDMRHDISIGVQLYRLRHGSPVLLDGQNYDRKYLYLARSPDLYTNIREVTLHQKLNPGTYVFIPSTFYPHEEKDFFFRVFTEKKAEPEILDDEISIDRPLVEEEDEHRKIFNEIAGGDARIDAQELRKVMTAAFKDEITEGFSTECARSFLAMMDRDQSGLLDYSEFKKMLKETSVWTSAFKMYDTDRSGNIDSYELGRVFKAIGFTLSRGIIASIIKRYGGKRRKLSFEDFLHCCSRLIVMYGQFTKYSSEGIKGKAEMSLEEWLSITMLY